jgi:hypothetical protein
VEHVFPESLGNKQETLAGVVCDSCQNYFSHEVEKFVLDKTVLGWARLLGRIPTKRGNLPSIDTKLVPRGAIPNDTTSHTHIKAELLEDGTVHLDFSGDAKEPVFENGELKLSMQFTSLVQVRLAQFWLKVGLEVICLRKPQLVRNSEFDQARKYARSGSIHQKWPVYFQMTDPDHPWSEPVVWGWRSSPFHDGTIWFEGLYAGMVFRFDLLSAKEHPTPVGFIRIS